MFENPDGSRTVVASAGAERVLGEAGQWQDVDLSLEESESGDLQPRVAAAGVVIAGSAQGLSTQVGAPGTPQDVVAALDTGRGVVSVVVPGLVQSPPHVTGGAGEGAAAGAGQAAELGAVVVPAGEALPAPVGASSPGARAVVAPGDTQVLMGALPGGGNVEVAAKVEGVESTYVLPDAASGAQLREVVRMPLGWSARAGGGAQDGVVELVDPFGVVGAVWSGGGVFDSAARRGESWASMRLLQVEELAADGESAAGVQVVAEVVMDQQWLGAVERVFPVRVDPTVVKQTVDPDAHDTWIQSGINSAQNGSGELRIGTFDGGATVAASLLKFNVSDLLPKTAQGEVGTSVIDASLRMYETYAASCSARPFTAIKVAAPWNPATVNWATQPAVFDSERAITLTEAHGYTGSCPAAWTNYMTMTSIVDGWVQDPASNNGVMVVADESDSLGWKKFRSKEGGSAPQLYVTYNKWPKKSDPVSPANESVSVSTTPLLTGTASSDPDGTSYDGQPLRYWFRVASGADAQSGSVVAESGWVNAVGATPPSWRVPAGALVDGSTYSWRIYTFDGAHVTDTGAVRSVRVNQRLGTSPTSPTDAIGSVTVNLATGNVATGVSTHVLPTVGGGLSVGMSYNSQQHTPMGLTGQYWATPNRAVAPVMTRLDPGVDVDWAGGTPNQMSMPSGNNFAVTWTGQLRTPTHDGATPMSYWKLGVYQDDKAKLWLNNTGDLDTPIVDGSAKAVGSTNWSGEQPPGTAGAIRLNYDEGTGNARVQLLVTGQTTAGATVGPFAVPATWLSPTLQELPAGWTLDAGDGSAEYVRAQVLPSAIALTGPDGQVTSFTKKAAASGGGHSYVPPAEVTDIVTILPNKKISVQADSGMEYLFSPSGELESAMSALDDTKPAATGYEYTDAPGSVLPRLVRIKDPVSGQALQLQYATTNPSSPLNPAAPACPATGTGMIAAPPLMLCTIGYPDGSRAELHYTGTAQRPVLARVVDQAQVPVSPTTPTGGLVHDLAYDSAGGLVSVRDPLGADAVAVDAAEADATSTTQIVYGTQTLPSGAPMVTTVTSPAPAAGAARPARNYQVALATSSGHPTGAGTTTVTDAGAQYPTGHLHPFESQVTFDTSARQLTHTDGTGVTGSGEWAPDDRVLSTTDGAGRKSTTIYDSSKRVIAAHGPAPQACFNTDRTPKPVTTGCPAMGTTTTAYDEGMQGLAVVGYSGDELAGRAKARGFMLTDPNGHLNGVWNTAPGYATAGKWSVRATGTIAIDKHTAGYTLKLVGDDKARLYIDDLLVIDGWASAAGPKGTWVNTFTDGGTADNTVVRHRIRLEHANTGGPGSVQVLWTPPGGSEQTIPGSVLKPEFGLATTTTTTDSGGAAPTQVQSTSYTDTTTALTPAHGLATSTTVDPAGLALTTRTGYEPAGSPDGYLRAISKTMPSGAVSTTTHYGPTQTATNPCVPGSAAVSQAGQVKSTTAAGPAPVVTEQVHDASGRVVAARTVGDQDWTCTSYDGRGRTTQVTYPATGTTPARTLTYDHAVAANPLATSVTDPAGTITTVVDLLGRTTTYTDVWHVVTTTTYDQQGRTQSTTTTAPTPGSGTPPAPVTMTFTYDPAGRVLSTLRDGAVLATATYTPGTGELASVAYPAGVGPGGATGGNNTALNAITRDPFGQTTALQWAFPNTQPTLTDTVTRSRSGKVLTATLTDGPTSYPSSYTYDGAERLITATIPRHQLTYDYTSTTTTHCTPTGAEPAAGRNGNRMATTDLTDSGPPTTTGYCYDTADRLIATAVTGAPTGASPLTATNLSTTGGTNATLGYDTRGNTTQLANQTLTYDSADRNIGIDVTEPAAAGTTTLAYTRDATDRIVTRTHTPATGGGPAVITRYGYSTGADTPDITMSADRTVLEQLYGLPGGVTLTDTPSTDTWAYPNIHGDIITTTNQTGTRHQALPFATDPFGQPYTLDPTQPGHLATTTADDTTPDTQTGDMDNGWLGQHQRPYEHATTIATIHMGARPYLPALGRFLEIDPIDGGTDNDYTYVTDPINDTDLDGNFSFRKHMRKHWRTYALVAVTAASFALPVVGIAASAYRIYRVGQMVRTAASTSRTIRARSAARSVMTHWSRGSFPNRTQSIKYHYAKHKRPGQGIGDYMQQGAALARRVGATGRRTTVRGRGGGIVSGRGRTISSW